MSYYEKHKKERLLYQKIYNTANHDKYLAYQRNHYINNKDQYIERNKKNKIPTNRSRGRPRGFRPAKKEKSSYTLIEPNKEPIVCNKPIEGYIITKDFFTITDW